MKITTQGCIGFGIFLLFACIIMVQIEEAQIMNKQIQQYLSPTDRSSQLAMSNFLTPVKEIFAFLEDAIS